MAAVLFLSSCYAKQDDPLPIGKDNYTSLTVQQDGKERGAWGYVIFRNDKILIQQFTIPAVEGNRHFANRDQAALVGSFVTKKLNHAQHPGISKKELDSLGIIQLN
ncbi:MAG: DUF4907 domain-containing protein, partial [Bacteroidota bacterium]